MDLVHSQNQNSKLPLLKRLLLLLALLLVLTDTYAQYADLGVGNLKNQAWWFDWQGVTIANGTSKTFTTPDGLSISFVFSGVSSPPFPAIMNNCVCGVLSDAYNFSNAAVKPALYNTAGTTNCLFNVAITATRNGLNVPFTLIAADAEGSFFNNERTNLTTNGSAWKSLELYRTAGCPIVDPLVNCNTQSVRIVNTFQGTSNVGQSPLVSSNSLANGTLNVNVFLDKNGANGGMAVAFGILLPLDKGDLPASYGFTQHELKYSPVNTCNFSTPLPAMVQDQSLYLGAVAGDPDPIQGTDDNAAGVDEESISTFPAYNGSGTYSLTIPLHNATGNNAFLTGWFDYNRDGVFSAGESVTVTVAANTTSAALQWTGLPASLPSGTVTGFGFRLRLSSISQSGSPTGYAPDGEVEDYLVTTLQLPATPCNFWPKFAANSLSTAIPGSNTLTFGVSNISHLTGPDPYTALVPSNWFTPNPAIATTSPPNAVAHSLNDLGTFSIYPVTTNETGSITFINPPAQGFYLHVFQTVSRIDFDKSFALVSSDGDLHVGSSNSLISNVIIPDVGPGQSPDDANATIYFPPGISQVNFTLTSLSATPDGIRFAFTFPQDCITTAPGISGVINDYTPVLGFDVCKNIVAVEDAGKFNIGDTVLLIQMKGAEINTTNTAAFGDITNYKNAGNYEFNYVKSKTGNNIELKNVVTRSYDVPDGKVQLIRVPYYTDVVVTTGLTCLPWDGSKGGVLAFNVQNNIDMQADMDVSGRGFRGGITDNHDYTCHETGYFYNSMSTKAAFKGEGIFMLSENNMKGRGKSANGGGGGNGTNTGGGGGSNFGIGGVGGREFCLSPQLDVGGLGGSPINYSIISNKIFMGGGGGAGEENDNTGTSGGNGGGIVLITAASIKSNAFKIISKGITPTFCLDPNCGDGQGGGGAGGSAILNIVNFTDNLEVNTSAGSGGSYTNVSPFGYHGPGGGGGGGVVWLKSANLPSTIIHTSTGGVNGTWISTGQTGGAMSGTAGGNLFNFTLPVDGAPFKKNIDSVRFNENLTSCTGYDFKGLAYINTSPVVQWNWYFGDGGTATTQNTSHNYAASGSYNVKLVAVDINGCKDSIIKNVNTDANIADAGKDVLICSDQTVKVTLNGNYGASSYSWSPAGVLDNNTIRNPTATINTTTRFYLTATNAMGCPSIDSVDISIAPRPPAIPVKSGDIDCANPSVILSVSGGIKYLWSPATGLSDPTSPNPVANPDKTQIYTVTVTSGPGCSSKGSITVYNNRKISLAHFMPNAFTPNGDGINDCYGMKYWMYIRQLEFTIYNRWGEKVFTTNNPANCWDGLYKGKILAGNYVYYIKAKTDCGDVDLSGNLLLIR